jgi:hypothetical protein
MPETHFKQSPLPGVSVNLQPRDLQQTREACRKLVRQRAYISAGAAALPIPFLDLVVDAGILLDLIPEISQRFGLSADAIERMQPEQKAKTWKLIGQRGSQLLGIVITRALIRRSFSTLASRIVISQITRFIPFGGQLVAAALGYFVLRKIAYDHIEDCYAVAKEMR